MTIQIPVHLREEEVAALDAIVATGRYASRSDVLRAGLDRVLRVERDLEIEAAYEQGYGANPQAQWVGEAGLSSLVAFDRAEGDERL